MNFLIILNLILFQPITVHGEPILFNSLEDRTQIDFPEGGEILGPAFSIHANYLFSEYFLDKSFSMEGSKGVVFEGDSIKVNGYDLVFKNDLVNISESVNGYFQDFKFESNVMILDIQKNQFSLSGKEEKPLIFNDFFSISANFVQLNMNDQFLNAEKNVYFDFDKNSMNFHGTASSFEYRSDLGLLNFYNVFLSDDKGYDLKAEYLELNERKKELNLSGSFEIRLKND